MPPARSLRSGAPPSGASPDSRGWGGSGGEVGGREGGQGAVVLGGRLIYLCVGRGATPRQLPAETPESPAHVGSTPRAAEMFYAVIFPSPQRGQGVAGRYSNGLLLSPVLFLAGKRILSLLPNPFPTRWHLAVGTPPSSAVWSDSGNVQAAKFLRKHQEKSGRKISVKCVNNLSSFWLIDFYLDC